MSEAVCQQVLDLLQSIPKRGLPAAKQLFCTELNYSRANSRLSVRKWPPPAQDALADPQGEPPLLLAEHSSPLGAFHIIYSKLQANRRGRDFPLSLAAERQVIAQLLPDHPYALFLFSDPEERHWHLVNVRYDQEAGRRRIYRRIAVGPHERLRTAAERVAMLDLATLHPDLSGLAPLAIQQRHDEAFDVEAVTKEFFRRFADLYYRVRDEIAAVPTLEPEAESLAQLLLDRLLFLYFIQKKGWLNQDPDYLYNRFLAGHANRPDECSFYGEVVYPLFLALSDRHANRDLAGRLGIVPFLDGGLFELPLVSEGRRAAEARLPLSNATFGALFAELFEHFNFTITEDSPLDQEVAIDPEMLGKIFESLVLQREQDPGVDLRKATGSYYTPRPVVAFMCREALTEYLARQCGMERERIAALLDLPPAGRLSDAERAELEAAFSRAEAQALKNALLEVRACDPAVGSGAFLLGLLQAIANAVTLLDLHLHGDEILARRNYTYDLKKCVIERCLYGVDIQAQAVQICELRLWLSLIVDYELPAELPPAEAMAEIPTLPNLSYNVRQGDSLLERLFGQVVQLDELARARPAQELIAEVQRAKASYFEMKDTAEKRRLELRILELQTALAGRLLEAQSERVGGHQRSFFAEETAQERRQREAWESRRREYEELQARVESARRKLEGWRKAGDRHALGGEALRRKVLGDPDHPTFLWRVDFAEVYQERGGFDVMIANPPYVRQERITHLKADLRKVYPDVYHGVADLYVYFYAQGLKQLRPDGVLVYISSNKFMRAGYGATLRRLLGHEATLRTVIDFGDLPIFEATTYPTVLVVRKRPPPEGHAVQALTVDDIALVRHLPEVLRGQAWAQEQASLRPEGWALVRPAVQALLEKLRRSGTPLGEYVQGRFYYGIKTGLNEAFVIDQATRDRLIAEDPRSAEVIKPWLRGRDVKRWGVEWRQTYLVYVPWDFKIDAYPAVKKHLLEYRQQLANRPEVQESRFPWYALSRYGAEYADEFEKPKIIYQEIATYQAFAFTSAPLYLNNKCFFIPTNDLYLLALLNSRTGWFVLGQIASKLQGGAYALQSPYVSQFPVPILTPLQRAEIESLVRRLLECGGRGPQAAAWEEELNRLVYRVYGLTEEEVRLVESATAVRREGGESEEDEA